MALLCLMQDQPLSISSLITYAANRHGSREIVARTCEGPIHRTTWAEVEERSRRLAKALCELGVSEGDRIGTLAWNTHRHLECFYGVSGMGAVLHTINPRLFEDQIRYIINHAEDKYLICDLEFLPIVERLWPDLCALNGVILLCERHDMPKTSIIPSLFSYESMLEPPASDFQWPDVDERSASSLCYTSGTTGNPKGVLYSHRSTLIHALAANQPDKFGLTANDSILAIVSLYHANAWSLPYVAPLVGAKLVLIGPLHDPKSVHELIEGESTTFACAVPTVWRTLLTYLQETGKTVETLSRCLIGGTAMPKVIRDTFRDQFRVDVVHLWGMTETSPLGTIGTATPALDILSEEERSHQLLKQGRLPFGINIKVVGPDGELLPSDGASSGALWVRGHWVASGYFRHDDDALLDKDGWFPTGDTGTIDQFGYMEITDRLKDVIKSGGEWISSIELENLAMAHPGVDLAAAIAVDHPRWDERPVLVIVASKEGPPSKEEMLKYLRSKVAKWWLPDDILVIDEMPLTGTGKVLKSSLRDRFKTHLIDNGLV